MILKLYVIWYSRVTMVEFVAGDVVVVVVARLDDRPQLVVVGGERRTAVRTISWHGLVMPYHYFDLRSVVAANGDRYYRQRSSDGIDAMFGCWLNSSTIVPIPLFLLHSYLLMVPEVSVDWTAVTSWLIEADNR